MDPNNKAYRVKIATSAGNTYLICISYPLDSNMLNYGLDFYELSWPSGRRAQAIPSIRLATFKEELQKLHRASCTRAASSGGEEEFIAGKMRSVYGNDTIISMSAIDQSMDTYDL